jgi:hypothetical protein
MTTASASLGSHICDDDDGEDTHSLATCAQRFNAASLRCASFNDNNHIISLTTRQGAAFDVSPVHVQESCQHYTATSGGRSKK